MPNKNTNSVNIAVAPKTSPVIPPNFCFDIRPNKSTKHITRDIPKQIPNKGKKKYIGTSQSDTATNILNFDTRSIILPVLENFEES